MNITEVRPVMVKRKGDRITVIIEKLRKDNLNWDKFSISSLDEPIETLPKAFEALVEHALFIMLLPESYQECFKVTQVSYSYHSEDDVMGAVITCQKDLRNLNAPLNINTPLILEKDISKEGNQATFTDEAAKALYDLADAAIAYFDGERLQMEMQLDISKKKSEEDKLISDAIAIIKETHRASASALQRRLKIGYTRASKILDAMEERGLIGPPKGSDPREILMDIKGVA